MSEPNNPTNRNKTSSKDPALFRRTVKSGVWMSFLSVVTRVLDVGKIWLLANLLGLSKWGLLSLSVLAIEIVAIFTEPGFYAALIQKKENNRRYLDTAWTIGLLRGLLLGLAVYLFAPYAASFFDGTVEFSRYHLIKSGELAVKFRSGSDELSKYMWQGFSPQTRQLLEEYDRKSIPSAQMDDAIAMELNRVVSGENLYKQASTRGMEFSGYAHRLAGQVNQNEDFRRLNRRILQEAYPGMVKESVIDVPAMKTIIQLLSIYVVIGSLVNIGTVNFRKDLEFKKIFLFETVSKIVDITVTVVIVFFYRDVWAMVWGRMASICSRTVISYVICEYRPRISVDIAKARELWQFGRWISLFGILAFVMTRGSDVFLGKYLGPAMMGVYLLASRFAQAPATEITQVFSEVTFPAFSRIQDDMERLRNAYLKVYHFTAFITVPLCGLVFVLAPECVSLFMKKEFYGMIPLVQILAFKGLFFSLHATMGSVYRSIGKPWINMQLQVIQVVLLFVFIYPMTVRWGVNGTAWMIVLIAIIIQPLGYYLLIKTIHCRIWDILKAVIPPLSATVLMVVAITILRSLMFGHPTFISLLVLGTAGICVYLAGAFICEKIFGYQIRQIVLEQVSVLLGKKY